MILIKMRLEPSRLQWADISRAGLEAVCVCLCAVDQRVVVIWLNLWWLFRTTGLPSRVRILVYIILEFLKTLWVWVTATYHQFCPKGSYSFECVNTKNVRCYNNIVELNLGFFERQKRLLWDKEVIPCLFFRVKNPYIQGVTVETDPAKNSSSFCTRVIHL